MANPAIPLPSPVPKVLNLLLNPEPVKPAAVERNPSKQAAQEVAEKAFFLIHPSHHHKQPVIR